MEQLFNNRSQSNHPIHYQELSFLTTLVSTEYMQATNSTTTTPTDLETSTSIGIRPQELTQLVDMLDKFLNKITSSTRSTSDFWNLQADFYHNLHRQTQEIQSRVKQVCILQNILFDLYG